MSVKRMASTLLFSLNVTIWGRNAAARILWGPQPQFMVHCWELYRSHSIPHSGWEETVSKQRLCFLGKKRMLACCVVDETLQPGPLIANTKTRFAWLIWSFITQEWKFILLAVMVITQLLLCCVLKWDFSANNATFASHLLQENTVNNGRQKLMGNKTKAKHNVE